MAEAKQEMDPLAGRRTPEMVNEAAIEQLRRGASEFWRMTLNPLSYAHPMLVPLWLAWCPWLVLFG